MNKKYKIIFSLISIIIIIFGVILYKKYYKIETYNFQSYSISEKYENGFKKIKVDWRCFYSTTVMYHKLHQEKIKKEIQNYNDIILSTYYNTEGIKDTIYIKPDMMKNEVYNPYSLIETQRYTMKKVIILKTKKVNNKKF